MNILRSVNCMIDLETYGVNSNSVIVSIGACMFNKDEIFDTFYVNISRTTCESLGMTCDTETIEWWKSQPNAERLLSKDQVDIKTALVRFSEWFNLYKSKDTVFVWGNGAAFDNVILRNAYKTVGIECPWHFTCDRCYRTLLNSVKRKPMRTFSGVAHYALDDALHQAHILQCIHKDCC